MTDTYRDLVNSGFPKTVAKKLGLPRPAVLRRHVPGDLLVPGPVLVLHDDAAGAEADSLAEVLLGWDLDVRRRAGEGDRFAAVVVVVTGVAEPADLSAPFLALGGALRSLAPSGRVIVLTRPVAGEPGVTAARAGVIGALRSLAKELRAGATGNAVTVAEDVAVTAPGVVGALRFLLSGRSAYVSGQVLHVGAGGDLPADWERPLAGRVAVVTGAARGIGAAIARTLARDGAELVLVDVPAAGDALAKVANAVRGVAVQLDITAPDAAERLLEAVRPRGGTIDILVHNAGITRDKLLANMTAEKWDPVIAVNVTAPLTLTEALLAADGFGPAPRVVCLASTSGIAGNRGQTNYAASKAGVIGLVRGLAPALAAAGGTVTAVAPGFIETDMTARMPFATREVARRLNSLQQAGLPVDVAEAIAFLASPPAGGITGETLRVCGQNLVGA